MRLHRRRPPAFKQEGNTGNIGQLATEAPVAVAVTFLIDVITVTSVSVSSNSVWKVELAGLLTVELSRGAGPPPNARFVYTSRVDGTAFWSIFLCVAAACAQSSRRFIAFRNTTVELWRCYLFLLFRIYRGCSRKSCNALNLSQDFRLLSICPMLFCFRLFYFRFKSFVRAELKCDIKPNRFRYKAYGVRTIFYPFFSTW